jgi:hypothetical protein
VNKRGNPTDLPWGREKFDSYLRAVTGKTVRGWLQQGNKGPVTFGFCPKCNHPESDHPANHGSDGFILFF